jgi:hypothetical protein
VGVLSMARRRIYMRALRWRIRLRLMSRRLKLIALVSITVISVGGGWHFRHHFHPTGNALDVLLGTTLLATVPFALAAYGGHIAAETLEDKRRRASVKRRFWGLCVIGIVLAFLQQYRAVRTDSANKQKAGQVEGHIVTLLEELNKPGLLSEAERRHKILQTLQQKYVITHDVDQSVIDGLEPPPSDWINEQLKELGERWNVVDSPKPQNVAHTTMIIQKPPEEKKATVTFSLYRPDMSGPIETVELDPLTDGRFTISIVAMVTGDTPAENLAIWIRECTICQWIPPNPPGFQDGDADHSFDKGTVIPELVPNVPTNKATFTIQLPRFPKADTIGIACYYACKNCVPVNWKKPQLLYVTKNLQNLFKLQIPSVSDIPEPGH